jgi:protein-glutamine gamma-glutamyltransferase
MPFDKALRLSSLLLAGGAFLGLALESELPGWLAAAAGATLLTRLLHGCGVAALDRLASHVTLSTATWNIFVVLGFAGFWTDMLWISGELLPAGIHFVVILLIIKVFNLQLRRDYLHLYAISLMALLGSAVSATDLWYLLVFLIYLFSGVWALLLFQLIKEPPDDPVGPPFGVTPQLFWLANGLAVGVLAFTLAIFFAIPRVSAGFLQNGVGESIRTSGFSETVNLGAIGPIKRDPSVVMRVELPDVSAHGPDPVYLRGVAYDRYDGTAWTNQFTHRRALAETAPLTFLVKDSAGRSLTKSGPLLRQNILLESLDTPVLFAAPFAETVSGRFVSVQSDAAGGLYLPFPSSSRIEYSVVSRPRQFLPTHAPVEPVHYPEYFARHFLQIPVQSERIARLALDITKDERSPYAKALAIEQYLSKNFRYSLDVPVTAQTHPLEDFLFGRRTGYCEHYATAMVVMLRTVGIPARLVTGFLATEWNEYGNYYLVRQQDAHAWVEVHLGQSGWISMDPTPAVSGEVPIAGWHTLGRMMDHLRLRWNRLFVQYSADDQIALVREVKTSSASVGNKAWESIASFLKTWTTRVETAVRQTVEGNRRFMGEFAGFAVLTVTLVWLGWKQPWKKGWQKTTPPEQKMTLLYKTMLEHLSGGGLPKPAAVPPFEFREMVRQTWREADNAVFTLTELYCRTRFGHASLTEDELCRAQDSLRQLMALKRTFHQPINESATP